MGGADFHFARPLYTRHDPELARAYARLSDTFCLIHTLCVPPAYLLLAGAFVKFLCDILSLRFWLEFDLSRFGVKNLHANSRIESWPPVPSYKNALRTHIQTVLINARVRAGAGTCASFSTAHENSAGFLVFILNCYVYIETRKAN